MRPDIAHGAVSSSSWSGNLAVGAGSGQMVPELIAAASKEWSTARSDVQGWVSTLGWIHGQALTLRRIRPVDQPHQWDLASGLVYIPHLVYRDKKLSTIGIDKPLVTTCWDYVPTDLKTGRKVHMFTSLCLSCATSVPTDLSAFFLSSMLQYGPCWYNGAAGVISNRTCEFGGLSMLFRCSLFL